jgi:hypothetical protein
MTTEPITNPADQDQLTQQIAQTLGETMPTPIHQIAQLVQVLGAEPSRALLQETLQVEAAGGMLIADGTRRRTPGGVFFKLARGRLSKAQQDAIFGPRWAHPQRTPSPQGSFTNSQPAAPPVRWSDRGGLIQEVAEQPGKAHTVKVTLIGKPGKVVARDDFTLLVMTHSGKLPALPKGIPVPARVPGTRYIVYVGGKQWRGVAEAIKNPDDVLIVEGTQVFDAEHNAIAVFATSVTTKALQQAKRQAQQGRAGV